MFKLDTKGFKKVAGDAHSTTLKHETAGHTLTISHKHLSPKWKAQLVALPHANKGETPEQAEEAHTAKKPPAGQAKIAPKPFAEGGDVYQSPLSADDTPKPDDGGGSDIISKIAPLAMMALADGGPVQEQSDDDKKKTLGEIIGYPTKKMYAEGSDEPVSQNDGAPSSNPQAPVTINIGQPQGGMSALPMGQQVAAQAPAQAPAPMPMPAASLQSQKAPSDPSTIDYSKADYSGEMPYGTVPPTAAPPQVKAQGAPIMPPAQGPDDMTKFVNAQAGGYGLQEKGINERAAAEAQAGKDVAGIEHKRAAFAMDEAQEEKIAQGAAQQSYDHFVHDVQKGFIKPNNYMENMSTPTKVSTAIGILLGGFGAGQGQGNPALEFLQKQIDRDMQAQEKNLASSENLLHHNLMQTRNMQDARAVTRAQINAGYAHQIDEALAKNRGPQAQAIADQGKGVLMQQNAMWLSQVGKSGGYKDDPAMAIRIMVPQHEQSAATKELGESEILLREHNNLMDALDKAAKLQTVANRLGSPIQSKQQINAILEPRIAALSKATAGRLTPQDVDMLRSYAPGLASSKKSIEIMKQEASKLIQEKMVAPTLEKYRINPFLKLRSPSGTGATNKNIPFTPSR